MSETRPEQVQPRNWAGPFFTIWIGQALSLVGSSAGGFALVWWLTEASGRSATILATATLVAMLPGVVLGPFAGALVDRWNRRRVMMVADTIIALFSAGLAFLFWAGKMQIWHVYVIMFVRSLGGTFHWPAMQASTSLMVPKEQLSRVAGMNQTLHGVLNIVTPALGAFLMKLLPLYAIMAIDVVTAAFAIGPLLFVHIPQPVRRQAVETAQTSLWQDVRYGFAYIWHWKGLFLALLMALVINMLVNPGMSLMPILVTKYFDKGVLELGWMNSGWGLGVILGGLILSVWGGFKSKIVTTMTGLIGMGIGLFLVGVVPGSAFWVGLVGVALAGVMNTIANAPFMALFQEAIDPEVQGRVFTAISSITALATPVGMAAAGPIADWLGVQVWFVLGGLACVAMGISGFFIPAIRSIETQGRAAAIKANGGMAPETMTVE